MLRLARCERLLRRRGNLGSLQMGGLAYAFAGVKGAKPTTAQDSPGRSKAQQGSDIAGGCRLNSSNTTNTSSTTNLADFHRFADMYLGGLWNRIESQLRAKEGEKFDYDVNVSSGCLALRLPDDGLIKICKLPEEQSLHVESNLHDVFGGGDPRDEAYFRLNDSTGDFEDGGMVLHTYLESHLARHLKVQLDLEPQNQSSANATVYSHDPT